MSTLATVSTALRDVLATIPGLRVVEHVPESLNPPALLLSLQEIERGTMGRGTMRITYDAVLLLSRASDRVSQQTLHRYADPSTSVTESVWAAIDENRSLGLSDCDASVARYRALGIEEIAAYGYVGGVFEVAVLTRGV